MFWITFFQMLAFGKSYTLLDQDIFEDPLTFQQKNKKKTVRIRPALN
jgi:hypothetical protein